MAYFNVPMINKVIITGVVLNDPKISLTIENKLKVANFKIVNERKFRLKSGQLKDDNCFVSITAWFRLADICERNLKKGDKVYIEGSLQSKQLIDKQNPEKKITFIEIVADRIQILTPKRIYSGKNTEGVEQEQNEAMVEENEGIEGA